MVYSRILHDVDRSSGTFGKAGAAEGSGDDLVVTATRAKELAEFTVFSTEAIGGIIILEASHTSGPTLDAAMVLLGSPIANDKSGPARWMER